MSNGKAQRYVSTPKDFKGTIIVERADWMSEAYKENIDSYGPLLSLDPEDPIQSGEIIYQKNLLLNEIFKLAGFAYMYSIVEKTRRHAPKAELEAEEVFKTLVEMYIGDPQTKSSIGRIRSWRDHDKEYDIGREPGHYNMPSVDPKVRYKTISLIGDPDLKPVMPPPPPEPQISKISPEQEQSFGEPISGDETLPRSLSENKIRVRLIKR
jgi:hypothetical protein